jgi:hypothetical protein
MDRSPEAVSKIAGISNAGNPLDQRLSINRASTASDDEVFRTPDNGQLMYDAIET